MAQWYYSSSGTQVGPVETPELARLAKTGGLQPSDLVWKEGMAEWVPASRVKGLFDGAAVAAQPVAAAAPASYAAPQAYAAPQPYATPVQSLGYQPTGGSMPVTPRTVQLLRETKPWTRLISVLLFIGCAFAILGGLAVTLLGGAFGGVRGGSLGMIIGVVYLLLGCLYFFPALFLSRYASRIGSLIMTNRSDDLEAAIEAQKSFWKFVGVAALVVIGVYILIIVFAISMR